MSRNKKWIWFDLDDTLHDFSSASRLASSSILKMLSDRAQMPLNEVEANYRQMLMAHNELAFSDGRASHEYRYERFKGAIEGCLLPAFIIQSIVEDAVATYETLFMNGLKLKEGTIETLQFLRNKSYYLAILSDAPHDAQKRVIEQLKLDELLDHLFTSGSLKVSKQKGMFNVVLEKLSVLPEDVTMIGDSLERDVKPALAAHLQAIWFNEKRLPNQQDFREIHTLEQLQRIIE